jgi:hypothetical protein
MLIIIPNNKIILNKKFIIQSYYILLHLVLVHLRYSN